MTNALALFIVLGIFIFVMLIFTKEDSDYVAYALIAAVASSIVTTFATNKDISSFLDYLELEPLIFIICMQVIIEITRDQKIFQWLALKALHITRGDPRKFLLLIGVVEALLSAVVSDITIAIIFVPLVIRVARILKINPSPFIFEVSFAAHLGSVYTPFSSGENILIATSFNLSLPWFLTYFTIFVFPSLFIALFIIDKFMLSKQAPPTERDQSILLEIMQPGLVIIDKKQFKLNSIYFIMVIMSFLFVHQAYLVAAFGAFIMALLNHREFVSYVKKIDWHIIFFLSGTFILMGCLQELGLFEILGHWAGQALPSNVLLSAIIFLVLISLLSGFLAQIPTAIMFISLLETTYETSDGTAAHIPVLIIIAFLIGINIGAGLLPQGAALDLMCLALAKERKVETFNYKIFLKWGLKISIIHIIDAIIYLSILYLFIGNAFVEIIP